MGKNTGEFEQACRDNLVAVAEAYAKATELSLSTVSRKFHGNQAFFAKFKKGACSLTLPKVDEMLRAFGEAWPSALPPPALRLVRMRVGKRLPSPFERSHESLR